jgi:hypothetical protein
MKASIDGWIKMSKSLIEILDSGVDQKYFRYIGDLYNIKFVKEDLFISFVVQNCAMEYYKIQNEYNKLEQNDETLPKHIDIMRRRFELFLKVLIPLAEMIETHGSLKEVA